MPVPTNVLASACRQQGGLSLIAILVGQVIEKVGVDVEPASSRLTNQPGLSRAQKSPASGPDSLEMSRFHAPCQPLFLQDVEDVKREDDHDRNA